MSFFTPQTKTVRIDGDNSITVRKLTFGEFSQILDRNGENQQKMGFDLVRSAIVSWSGSGFENREVTPENVDNLPWEIIAEIVPVVTDLNSASENVEGKA
jgi:hypothetical protein